MLITIKTINIIIIKKKNAQILYYNKNVGKIIVLVKKI